MSCACVFELKKEKSKKIESTQDSVSSRRTCMKLQYFLSVFISSVALQKRIYRHPHALETISSYEIIRT